MTAVWSAHPFAASRLFPSRKREGVGGGLSLISSKMAASWIRTPSICSITSEFQNRTTRNPSASRKAVRRSSRLDSLCWPPSTSTISRASRHRKSQIYGPIGIWRENFQPPSWRLLRWRQSFRSGSVAALRNVCARAVGRGRNVAMSVHAHPHAAKSIVSYDRFLLHPPASGRGVNSASLSPDRSPGPVRCCWRGGL